MRSLFPGMDPYLEPHWLDVHSRLVSYSADALTSLLPEDLLARIDERVAIESRDDEGAAETSYVSPDVRILTATQTAAQFEEARRGAVTALAPVRLVALREPVMERYLSIVEATGEKLITVIEFISPGNKIGRGLREFKRKRRALLKGDVNMVEVDLVRAGNWRRLLGKLYRVKPEDATTYRVTIRRPREPGGIVYMQPIALREPLPSIKIPLRKDETPIELPLQPLLDRAYEMGRYAKTIDYSKPLDPPLPEADATWLKERLEKRGPK